MKVVFAPEAEHDLDSALDFLTSRNPPAAAQLVDGVYYQRADEVLRIVRIYHQSRRPITR